MFLLCSTTQCIPGLEKHCTSVNIFLTARSKTNGRNHPIEVKNMVKYLPFYTLHIDAPLFGFPLHNVTRQSLPIHSTRPSCSPQSSRAEHVASNMQQSAIEGGTRHETRAASDNDIVFNLVLQHRLLFTHFLSSHMNSPLLVMSNMQLIFCQLLIFTYDCWHGYASLQTRRSNKFFRVSNNLVFVPVYVSLIIPTLQTKEVLHTYHDLLQQTYLF